MRGKSLWFGFAALWVCVLLAAVALVAWPERQGAVVQVGEVEESSDPLAAEGSPLDAPTRAAPITTPDPKTTDDTPTKPATTEIDPTETVTPEPAEPRPESSRPDAVVDSSGTSKPTSYRDVTVPTGGTLTLPNGEVKVDGDWTNDGTVNSTGTTLVFDGTDQTLDGSLTAKKVILRGGTKRIRGNIGTTHGGDAQPGHAGLYVEAGTTLIIEKGGKWNTPNPYGFQIAGDLIIDGGEFNCRFSNGNGTDRGEESWLAGSTLTINSGKFIGNGDADFSGCAITIHDGALEINDDIWNSGDSLTMFGGSMRNTTGGGMFYVTGTVALRDGKLDVYQNSGRSLRIAKDASVYCTGGEITINGSAATADDGGIYLGSSATLPDLVIKADTKIHKDSIEGAYLSVAGDMSIDKGFKFNAAGRQVISNFTPSEETGEFIP